MGSRRKGRELALQALYQLDITGDDSEKALADLAESFEAGSGARTFAVELVRGVLARRGEIDVLIEDAAANWRLDRLSRIDAIVMRIAIYEMITPPGLPVEIAVNEAVDLARKFGNTESASFVNGILDEIARRRGLKDGSSEPNRSPSESVARAGTRRG